MTHSHDTATPALRVERGEAAKWPSGCIKRSSCARHHMCMYGGFNGSCPHSERSIKEEVEAAAPAPNPSPAAKGGEAVVVPYDDFHAAYRFVPRSKVSPDRCLKTRLRALLRAEDLAHADEAEALATSSPQPADAVREARDHSTCTMGVGCETYGVCYADAAGKPDRCAALASDPAPAGEAVELWHCVHKGGDNDFWTSEYKTAEACAASGRYDVSRKTLHPAPEDTARLREDLAEAVRQIEANIAAIERSKEFVQKATALTQTAERERDDARKALVTVQEALKPFSDYADPLRTAYPDDMPMTKGSAIAARQVTAGDFRRAREAYHAAARSASREGASDE